MKGDSTGGKRQVADSRRHTDSARERGLSLGTLDSLVRCRQCGKPVEKLRECYAIPVCYACLPPPPPLPRIHTPKAEHDTRQQQNNQKG